MVTKRESLKINKDKDLDENEKKLVKENLRGLINNKLTVVKNDYENKFKKGTVEYDSKIRNYCFHNVTIPDGTIIRETNFTQASPETECIKGKNLHFHFCNLINVKLDPSWTFEGGLRIQKRKIKESSVIDGDGNKEIVIKNEKLINGEWVSDYTKTLKIIEKDEEELDEYLGVQNGA